MAGDPFRKVAAGERLVIPAPAYNAFIDAAMAARQRKQEPGNRPQVLGPQATTIFVQNNTSGDLDKGAILGVSAPLITVAENLDGFLDGTPLVGIEPDHDEHEGKFVVLLDPIPSGEIGRAVISGLVAARVNITDTGHKWAECSTGSYALASGTSGSARIIASEGTTGEQWAVVRLCNASSAVGL